MNYEYLKLSQTEEVWVPITEKVVPYIRPHYYISNWGRIGSIASGSFKLLSLVKDSNGYLNICLHLYLNIIDDKGHVRRQINKRVNRLVIMSFYDIPENHEVLEVNHINSIRDDNHLWNLEWVTSKENTMHALKNGYKEIPDIQGSKNPMSKLTEDDVYKIVDLVKYDKYITSKKLGEMFNVKSSTITNILSRRSWNHLELDITNETLSNFKIRRSNISSSFTNEELHAVCSFFESNDINNTCIYPGPVSVVKDCFYTLNLDKKYNFQTKKKTLIKILRKSTRSHDPITSKYNYKFIR